MKHTPGPWIVNESQEDCLYGKVSIETEGEYFIAQVDESINQAANARLIAAAPELLEALQRLSAQCTRLRLPGQPETDAEKTARAVIAKTTGGAE